MKQHFSISYGFQSFHSPWMDERHVWGLNLETRAQIKRLKTCGPLVIVWGKTNIASIWEAVSARRRLLYQTNYKKIIRDILWLHFKLHKAVCFWIKPARNHGWLRIFVCIKCQVRCNLRWVSTYLSRKRPPPTKDGANKCLGEGCSIHCHKNNLKTKTRLKISRENS